MKESIQIQSTNHLLVRWLNHRARNQFKTSWRITFIRWTLSVLTQADRRTTAEMIGSPISSHHDTITGSTRHRESDAIRREDINGGLNVPKMTAKESFTCWTWVHVSSCAGPGGPSVQNSCRRLYSRRAWRQCAFWCDVSARPIWQSATDTWQNDTCTAFHPCEFSGGLSNASFWCRPSDNLEKIKQELHVDVRNDK